MEYVKVFDSLEEAEKTIPKKESALVNIGSLKICLAHTDEGFKAIANACPHNGASLSDGKINYLGEVVCPLHGYRFNLNDGREADGKCGEAETFPVEINDKGLHICV